MQLFNLNMRQVDYRQVAEQVYDLAESQLSISPLVKQALTVIDDAIDSFGYVQLTSLSDGVPNTQLNQGRIT